MLENVRFLRPDWTGNSPTLPEWSADVAYVIGLIATDGNLARKRPVITIVSKDTDLLETIRRCLGLITPSSRIPEGPATIATILPGMTDRCMSGSAESA